MNDSTAKKELHDFAAEAAYAYRFAGSYDAKDTREGFRTNESSHVIMQRKGHGVKITKRK